MLRLLLPYYRHCGSFALYCIGDLDTYNHCLLLVITCMSEQIQHELVYSRHVGFAVFTLLKMHLMK